MKITSFDPVIVSPDADSIVSLFESLGFEKTHAPSNTLNGNDVISNRMKHPEGYHLDVVSTSSDLQQDHMLIRMNVDDFEEAYEILTSRGFKNVNGDKTYDVKSSKSAVMESPSGFRISIVKHIK